jgi:hypothetical protein
MSKSNSDPLSEGKLWGNLSPKSRLKAYMPQKRKTSSSKKKTYKIPSWIDEEEMNARLLELETPDLPVAPSGYLLPSPPRTKPTRKSPTLVFPAVPTAKPSAKSQASKPKMTGTMKLMLNRAKLAKKAEEQTKKHRTIREKLDALVNRFKKGGNTFHKRSLNKTRSKSTFPKSRAKRNRTRKLR